MYKLYSALIIAEKLSNVIENFWMSPGLFDELPSDNSGSASIQLFVP